MDSLKTHVQSLNRMCECAYRNKVYTTFSIVTQCFKSNTPRRLSLISTRNHIHRLLCGSDVKIIKHNTIHSTTVHHLLQLIKITHLYFYLQVQMLFLQIIVTAIDGISNTSSKIHMIVFQQNHIKKTNTVIDTSTEWNGVRCQHTHTWRCLPCIQHMSLCTFQTLHILMSHRSDSAHTLHNIKH